MPVAFWFSLQILVTKGLKSGLSKEKYYEYESLFLLAVEGLTAVFVGFSLRPNLLGYSVMLSCVQSHMA